MERAITQEAYSNEQQETWFVIFKEKSIYTN